MGVGVSRNCAHNAALSEHNERRGAVQFAKFGVCALPGWELTAGYKLAIRVHYTSWRFEWISQTDAHAYICLVFCGRS